VYGQPITTPFHPFDQQYKCNLLPIRSQNTYNILSRYLPCNSLAAASFLPYNDTMQFILYSSTRCQEIQQRNGMECRKLVAGRLD
jgi:hypothetical protein